MYIVFYETTNSIKLSTRVIFTKLAFFYVNSHHHKAMFIIGSYGKIN